MFQSLKDQYIFLHEAVAEALYIGTHSIFLNQFEAVYGYLCEDDKDKGECRLALQHEVNEYAILAQLVFFWLSKITSELLLQY